MTPLYVVLLVVAILAVNGILWAFILRWIRAKSAEIARSLADELASCGERVVRPPEPGLYRGASSRFPRVKGNCLMALTERRLVFRTLTGGHVDVPLSQVRSVRDDKWFLGGSTGRIHLIVRLEDGVEVGFYTVPATHVAWKDALEQAARR